MDLNKMGLFRDASLSNLRWLEDAVTEDASKIKDPTDGEREELAVEWGTDADIGPFEDKVNRNLPLDDRYLGDAERVIRFARERLHMGIMGADLGRRMRAKFSAEDIRSAVPGLRKVLALEGLLGTVMINAEGFDSCEEAMRYASKSPFRRHIRFIANCRCGSHHDVPDDDGQYFDESPRTTGNAIDDVLAQRPGHTASTRRMCPRTMKQVIGGISDFSKEYMDGTLIDLLTLGDLTEEQAEEIQKGTEPAKVLKKAFKLIALGRARRRLVAPSVTAKDHSREFSMADADVAFDVDDEPMRQAMLDVDVTDNGLDGHVSLSPEAEPKAEVIDVKAGMREEIDFFDCSGGLDITLDGEPLNASVPDQEESPDIDMDGYGPRRFGNEPVIELDPEFEPDELLELETGGDMQIDV